MAIKSTRDHEHTRDHEKNDVRVAFQSKASLDFSNTNKGKISKTLLTTYKTVQNDLDHCKRCAQGLSAENTSKHFKRSHNTALFEMIARLQFPPCKLTFC